MVKKIALVLVGILHRLGHLAMGTGQLRLDAGKGAVTDFVEHKTRN